MKDPSQYQIRLESSNLEIVWNIDFIALRQLEGERNGFYGRKGVRRGRVGSSILILVWRPVGLKQSKDMRQRHVLIKPNSSGKR